jgi:NAD(P)H-binding
VARCLIIGCGCRGRALTARLRAAGHLVRGTSRDPARARELEAAGAEPFIGDPDRVGTIVPALGQVSVVCVLLGSAAGDLERLAALHCPRLEMLMHKLLDTTARGIVYEASGTVPPGVLERGASLVRAAAERSRMPYALIEVNPDDHKAWLEAAYAAVERALGQTP